MGRAARPDWVETFKDWFCVALAVFYAALLAILAASLVFIYSAAKAAEVLS